MTFLATEAAIEYAGATPVIEDAASPWEHPSTVALAVQWVSFAAFSFYQRKNLGACGEAGAITTNDTKKAQLLRSMRDWGQEGKGNHANPGFNYRMDGLQGAILGIKLKHLNEWTEARNRVATLYRELLEGEERITLPSLRSGAAHSYHIFAVLTPKRDRIANEMRKAGIGCESHYPVPIHLHPTSVNLGYSKGDFPVAERMHLRKSLYPFTRN
jgi:dTDP-4-amino-4,6-dideoxygalactose transaminase